MMNTDVNLYVEREALARKLLTVDDAYVLDEVRKALKRALATVKKAASQKEEEKVEYITKEEQEEMLLNAFTEMFRARKEGRKLKSAEELLNEL